MNLFLRHWKHQAGLFALSLMLLAAHGGAAVAAPVASFSATATGPINNLTLTATINAADADLGQSGVAYVGVNFNNLWFFNSNAAWVQYSGGAAPVYAAGPIASGSFDVVRNADVSSLVGAKVYVGYGLSQNDMVANGKFAMVYTIGPDTTAPTVTSTSPLANATGVAGNTLVTATFSEAMDPLTINNATMQLACPTGAAIAGNVSYVSSSNVASFAPTSNLPAGSQCTATIRTGAKDLAGNALASELVWTFSTVASLPLGPSRVNLGTAGNFAILAKTAISTVPASAITGDVGVSPAATSYLTGFSLTMVGTTAATSPQVTGNLYGADMTTPTSSNLTTAVLDMQAAYTDAAGRSTPDFLNLNSGNIGGLTLAPGLYNWGGSVTAPADVTISGGANDVWIFQTSGDLTVSTSKRITLVGGAQAKNIFWQVAGQVTVGAGAQLEGNVLSQTGILLMTGATLNGRALAQTQVALQSATVTKPGL